MSLHLSWLRYIFIQYFSCKEKELICELGIEIGTNNLRSFTLFATTDLLGLDLILSTNFLFLPAYLLHRHPLILNSQIFYLKIYLMPKALHLA